MLEGLGYPLHGNKGAGYGIINESEGWDTAVRQILPYAEMIQ